ncbi:MAG: inorganic phosphate transporter [Clostridia bacterium]|nr:inorganic phosphate transporter [Clostridia bacterium]
MTYLIVLLVLTSVYTFYMGFTDGSNAIATTVATRAIDPRLAVVIGAVTQTATVLLMFVISADLSVAATVGKGIVRSSFFGGLTPAKGFIYLLAALLSAIVWSAITYVLKQPNSTSHTLLGGIIGAGIAAFGFKAILWANVFFRIILMIFLAPLVSVLIGFIINRLLKRIALRAPGGAGKFVKVLQWIHMVTIASAISVNDAQKSIGIYFLIVSLGIASIPATPPFYLICVFAFSLGLGMIFGGYRIILTIGRRLFRIKPFMALSSQIATNIVMFGSSFLGIPISTGQVVSSSVVGIGISERANGVKWITVRRIVLGWIITMPATILFGAIFYFLTNVLLGGIL